MRRLLDHANQRLIYTMLFLVMAVQDGQGLSWPAVAKYAAGAAVAVGGWTIRERLIQQEKRDNDQDANMKDALREIIAQNKESAQQLRDLSSSAVTRAGDAISAGLVLKSGVDDLKTSVAELKEQIKDERLKREARDQKDYDRAMAEGKERKK